MCSLLGKADPYAVLFCTFGAEDSKEAYSEEEQYYGKLHIREI